MKETVTVESDDDEIPQPSTSKATKFKVPKAEKSIVYSKEPKSFVSYNDALKDLRDRHKKEEDQLYVKYHIYVDEDEDDDGGIKEPPVIKKVSYFFIFK